MYDSKYMTAWESRGSKYVKHKKCVVQIRNYKPQLSHATRTLTFYARTLNRTLEIRKKCNYLKKIIYVNFPIDCILS